ncbi:MAG: hypothetical protein IPP40_08760 [bacterium]|nr:hypothetical protein [bacterium]
MKVIWELESVELGSHDVVFKNSPSVSVTELAGLTVEASRGLTYEFIDASPDHFRAGGTPQFTFIVRNTSNIDLPYFETSVYVPASTDILGIQTDGNMIEFQSADSESVSQSYLRWDLNDAWDSAKIVFALGRDVPPGDLSSMTLTIRFMYRYFSVNVSCEAFSVQDYIGEQLIKFDALRSRIAENQLDADPELTLLSSDSAAFVDTMLSYYFADGIIDQSADIPTLEIERQRLSRSLDDDCQGLYCIPQRFHRFEYCHCHRHQCLVAEVAAVAACGAGTLSNTLKIVNSG